MLSVGEGSLRIDAGVVDYLVVGVYFVCVLGIGVVARRGMSASMDFFLSGRTLPAWVTGIAFVSANLGAGEIMGMAATGAQYGLPTVHYYWVGAIPAMLFLGVVMMPFYYGSSARSVPEFMRLRFGIPAHLVISVAFLAAQVLMAGVNLYLLGSVVNALLGWPLWLSVVVSAAIVLIYIVLGGLSAAIYNEVLQFCVIVAALLPLTIAGLHRVGGWNGLRNRVVRGPGGVAQWHAWPGTELTGLHNDTLSVIGIIFGLGLAMSFGYWTTNYVEVQRAMAASSLNAARRAPIIGALAKMFLPFIVVVPGMIGAVLVPQLIAVKAGLPTHDPNAGYNNALLYLMKTVLPTGMLGVALTGLLASFMAGTAANISACNTVCSYDLWQHYIRPDRTDSYYLAVGRWATIGIVLASVATAFIASRFGNVMDYLETLASVFNAPLFATFGLGVVWARMTPTAGWTGLVAGSATAIGVFALNEIGVMHLPGQGSSFVGSCAACVVDLLVSVVVTALSEPKPTGELVGLVYSRASRLPPVDSEQYSLPWHRRPLRLAAAMLALVTILNVMFR